MSDGVDV